MSFLKIAVRKFQQSDSLNPSVNIAHFLNIAVICHVYVTFFKSNSNEAFLLMKLEKTLMCCLILCKSYFLEHLNTASVRLIQVWDALNIPLLFQIEAVFICFNRIVFLETMRLNLALKIIMFAKMTSFTFFYNSARSVFTFVRADRRAKLLT